MDCISFHQTHRFRLQLEKSQSKWPFGLKKGKWPKLQEITDWLAERQTRMLPGRPRAPPLLAGARAERFSPREPLKPLSECKSKTRENKDPPRAGDLCCLHAQAANGGSGSACPWACEPCVGVGTGLGPRPRAPSPARRSARVKGGRRRDPVSAQCSGESGAHHGLTGTAPRVCVSGCAAPCPAQPRRVRFGRREEQWGFLAL